MEIDHIGIAVKALKDSGGRFSEMLGEEAHEKVVEREGVKVAVFEESRIELLEPLNTDNSMARFIERRGEGIHHIALKVYDMDRKIDELRTLGFSFTADTPSVGAEGRRIIFIHPRSTGGVLVELVEGD